MFHLLSWHTDTQATGRAGSDFNIQIRGKSSIQGTSKPIYVVDGVICEDIGFLNTQDIERMDILKDASSTHIIICGVVVVSSSFLAPLCRFRYGTV